MAKHESYWQLIKVKEQKPCKTLVQLGTIAEHHGTEMAHSMLRAVIIAKYNGSAYGWV